MVVIVIVIFELCFAIWKGKGRIAAVALTISQSVVVVVIVSQRGDILLVLGERGWAWGGGGHS